GEAIRGRLTRRQSSFPGTLQLIDAGQAPVHLGGSEPIAGSTMRLAQLAPRAGRLSQITGELGTAAEQVQREQPPWVLISIRPQPERPPGRLSRIAIRVDRARGLGGGQ